MVRDKTHDKATTVLINLLLQRRLTEMLGNVGASALRTNLIIHHGIADILDQSAKLIHVFGAVQEPCDLASLFQWGEGLENFVRFTSPLCKSDQLPPFENVVTVREPLSSRPPFCRSQEPACRAIWPALRPSTRGINNFIVSRQAIVF
jgi:hypothetical protein